MANEIAKVQGTGYLVSGEMSKVLAEEFKGLDISEGSFPKIKIPSGGGLAFEVPGDDPDSPDMVKSFDAVILQHNTINVYYKDKYTGDNTPPDCHSKDGITGMDRETGECKKCEECPLNEYGSGEGGNGKACQNKCVLSLLREGECIPTILTLPATSVAPLKQYKLRLVSKGIRTHSVVTRFALRKATSKGGIIYSEATFTAARKLSEEELKSINKITQFLNTQDGGEE